MRSRGVGAGTGLWKEHGDTPRGTLSTIGASPEVTDDFIDFFHFHTVEFHYCSRKKASATFNRIIIW